MGAIKKHNEYNDFVNQCELAMIENPLILTATHKFAPGIYRRELFVPKGAFITSKVHLTDHFFEVLSGVIDVCTEDGPVRMIAPYDCMSKAGTRKVGFAVEDVLMATFHSNPDNCQDIPTLEKRLFEDYNNPLLKLI